MVRTKFDGDYLVREIETNHYEVTKWDGHAEPAAIYQVYDRGRDRWYCSCPARGSCKHVGIVKAWIQKGKPGTDDIPKKAKEIYQLLKKVGIKV